jgi:hypothetical protein
MTVRCLSPAPGVVRLAHLQPGRRLWLVSSSRGVREARLVGWLARPGSGGYGHRNRLQIG